MYIFCYLFNVQVVGTTIDWIAAIRKHEKELLAKLRAVFTDHPQVQAFLADRTSIESAVRAMENVCQLSDVIARERSVELLLLKDDLASRMTSLLQTTHIELPRDVETKSICFVKMPPLGAVCAEEGFNFGRISLIDAANVTDDMHVDELTHGRCHQNAEDDGERQRLKTETEIDGTCVENQASNFVKQIKVCDESSHKKELSDQSTMTDWELAPVNDNEFITTSSNVSQQPPLTEVQNRIEIPNTEMTLTKPPPTVSRSALTAGHTSQSSRSRSKSKSPSTNSSPTVPSSKTTTSSSKKIATRGDGHSRGVRCVSTLTDPPNTINKSTVTERPFQLDKVWHVHTHTRMHTRTGGCARR
jgi:hypothetical protein